MSPSLQHSPPIAPYAGRLDGVGVVARVRLSCTGASALGCRKMARTGPP